MISDDPRDYGIFADGATRDSQKTYQDCFQKWLRSWERCSNAEKEYFEGDKAHSGSSMSDKNIKNNISEIFEHYI
jgi:hypothetical protein